MRQPGAKPKQNKAVVLLQAGAVESMTLDWKGEKYIRAVAEGNRKGLTLAALAVQAQASRLAPKDTRNLSNSIAYNVTDEDAIIGTNVEYAPYQEFGTSKMSAQPFLEPALHNNKKKIEHLIKGEIAKAIKGAGR